MAAPEAGSAGLYRNQEVEIALGARGAFENGNIGVLARQLSVDQLVSVVPPRRRKPEPRQNPETPCVVKLLRKALEWRALVESGDMPNRAAIARREGITRARVSQVIGLLRLAPEIRQYLLTMPDQFRRPAITERALRAVARLPQGKDQLDSFQNLLRSLRPAS